MKATPTPEATGKAAKPVLEARTPRVSAVVATRDRLELLRQAVGAIVAQRYEGVIETVVVIDGGPRPEDLANDDPKRPVRVISNTRRPGLAGGRNTGILAATGEFVAFCDDDDLWLRDKVAMQLGLLEEHPGALLAVTGMTVNVGGRRIDRVHPAERIPLSEFVRSRVQEAHPSSFLWRASAFERIGLIDEELPGAYGEDRDILIRAARVADVVNVPRPLVEVNWHAGSFFMDRWATIAESIDYMLAKHPELSRSARGHARLLGRRAFAKAATGDRSAAVSSAMRSLRRWPGDRRALVALVVSSGVVSADRAQRTANRFGRGI